MPQDKDSEQQDIKLIELLTNKPSEPILIEKSDTYLVFQAPSFTDKYKGRTWASKKLKEIGVDEDEDQDLVYYFRYWGTINTYVTKIYVLDTNGSITIGDSKYREYTYDPTRDLNYKFLFEKYVLQEMYPRGMDEQFVTSVVIAHMNWVKDRALGEDDIKKD